MEHFLNLATGMGLGVMALSPVLVVLLVLDHRDRKRHRARMAAIEARYRT